MLPEVWEASKPGDLMREWRTRAVAKRTIRFQKSAGAPGMPPIRRLTLVGTRAERDPRVRWDTPEGSRAGNEKGRGADSSACAPAGLFGSGGPQHTRPKTLVFYPEELAKYRKKAPESTSRS